MLRELWRFLVLVVTDLAFFYVMRETMRAVRDAAVLGTRIATPVASALPRGILNGWQYAVALFLALFITGNYGRGDRRRDPQRLLVGCALATALPLWTALWTRGVEPVFVQYAITTLFMWAGLVVERRMIDRLVKWTRPVYRSEAATLFVGSSEDCREAMASPAFGGGECRPIGYVDVRVPAAGDAMGHLFDFPTLLHRHGAEVVVMCGYLHDIHFHHVVDAALAAGCKVLSMPRAIDIAGVEPTVAWRGDQPVIELTAPSLRGWQLAMKRCVDLAGAGVALLLTWPLMALIAVAMKLDSRGPVLFRQERVGTGGRRFDVLKFRTMKQGASDAAHREFLRKMLNDDEHGAIRRDGDGRPIYKLVDDPRVTRVGRWLRRTSLDELPQIINVLRGEMSLVGPRPPLPYEIEAYDHWQYDRLQVRPGITGLWQVSGRNLLTYREMCRLDVEYVRRWSLWLDLRILLKTVPVVLFNSGRAA